MTRLPYAGRDSESATPGNTISRSAAERHAARLRQYWRGHDVVVEVVEETVGQRRKPIFVVRSNLRAGLPMAGQGGASK
jgi:hypothetical protein